MDFVDTNGDYLVDQDIEKLKKYNDSHIFKTSEIIENIQGADSDDSK